MLISLSLMHESYLYSVISTTGRDFENVLALSKSLGIGTGYFI